MVIMTDFLKIFITVNLKGEITMVAFCSLKVIMLNFLLRCYTVDALVPNHRVPEIQSFLFNLTRSFRFGCSALCHSRWTIKKKTQPAATQRLNSAHLLAAPAQHHAATANKWMDVGGVCSGDLTGTQHRKQTNATWLSGSCCVHRHPTMGLYAAFALKSSLTIYSFTCK